MNKEQILQLSEEEINLRIAKFMGIYTENIKGKHYSYIEQLGKWDSISDYCHDMNLVYEVEEKIKLMDLKNNYIDALISILYDNGYGAFDIIHSSPIDRLRAALLTLEVNE